MYNNQVNQNAFDNANNQNYELRTYYNELTERQNALVLDVPVVIDFRTAIGEKWSFEWGLGAKLNVPVWNNYAVKSGSVETRGYYPSTNIEYANLPQHGFAILDEKPSGTTKLKTAGASVFTDLGFNYRMKESLLLYMGVYCNYGVTNMIEAGTEPLFTDKQVYTGTLASNQVSKVNALSAGIKLGLVLDFGAQMRSEKAVKTETEQKIAEQKAELERQQDKEERARIAAEEQAKADAAAKAETERLAAEEKVQREAEEKTRLANEEKVRSENEKVQMGIDINRYLAIINANSHFDHDKAILKLNNESERALDTLVTIIKDKPEVQLLIIGHTNDLGKDEYNMKLGQKRADAMKTELVKRSISESQLTTSSKGETEPLVPNTSESNRAKNIRIEIKVK